MQLILAEILGPDLLVVFGIVVLLFGGSQLPKLARSLGSAKREFEKGIAEGESNHRPTRQASTAPPDGTDSVTMTRAELDALLAEREGGRTDRC